MAEEQKTKYYIRAMGKPVEVSKELYLTYYRTRRQEKGLVEKDRYNGTQYYSDLDSDEMLGVENFADESTASVEDMVISKIMVEKLRDGIKSLDKSDRAMIQALFFEGRNLYQLAQESGVPYMTLRYRRDRALEKLKKLLE